MLPIRGLEVNVGPRIPEGKIAALVTIRNTPCMIKVEVSEDHISNSVWLEARCELRAQLYPIDCPQFFAPFVTDPNIYEKGSFAVAEYERSTHQGDTVLLI